MYITQKQPEPKRLHSYNAHIPIPLHPYSHTPVAASTGRYPVDKKALRSYLRYHAHAYFRACTHCARSTLPSLQGSLRAESVNPHG